MIDFLLVIAVGGIGGLLIDIWLIHSIVNDQAEI